MGRSHMEDKLSEAIKRHNLEQSRKEATRPGRYGKASKARRISSKVRESELLDEDPPVNPDEYLK